MHVYLASDRYWVWSPYGPSDNDSYAGYKMQDGIMPTPVDGLVAEKLVAFGLRAEPFSEDKEFVGWENVPGRPAKMAVFAIKKKTEPATVTKVVEVVAEPDPNRLPSLKYLKKLPDKLPKEYRELFAKYTLSGNLRKSKASGR